MNAPESPAGRPIEDLVRQLERAVDTSCPKRCTEGVKDALMRAVASDGAFLSPGWVARRPDHYARRLLHRDPEGRYSVVVMTWGDGQGTPVHDHAGLWCVECVYDGTIEVTSYSIDGDEPPVSERDCVVTLRRESAVRAGIGEAGALIPPFDHHRIANAGTRTAVTIHVYGGDMDWCHRFEPLDDGTWRRTRCELSFDPVDANAR